MVIAFSHSLDPEQFEKAREDAGIVFERFTAHVKRDGLGYPVEVGLLLAITRLP